FTFESGEAGDFYQPSNSQLIDADNSATAAAVGLHHYTVTTSQTKEGNSDLDIGFHYMALDENGSPVETDGGGVPDYLEDTNGNGVYDAGDFSDWRSLDSDGDGLPDEYEYNTTHTSLSLADTGSTGTSDAYKDSDGDGLTNLEELKLGTNPLLPNVASPI